MKKQRLKPTAIPIRYLIIYTFIVVLVSTTVLIGVIIFTNWNRETRNTISMISNNLNREVVEDVKSFLEVPVHIDEVNRKLLESGVINLSNSEEREIFFVNVLNTHDGKGVYSFSFGSETGEYYGARRSEDNVIQIMRNNASTGGHSWYYGVNKDMTAGELVVEAGSFDPRTRAWYKAAKESKDIVFSPIYKHFIMNDLTISVAAPIYNRENILQGVLGTHMILSNINRYLSDKVQSSDSTIIIVEKDSGELIANSYEMDNFNLDNDGSFKRLHINEIYNENIKEAYFNYIDNNMKEMNIKNKTTTLYSRVSLYEASGLKWLIITQVPESQFVVQIQNNIKMAFIMTIFAVLIAILFYLRVTKLILRPIESLILTTEKFSSGDLLQRETIKRNDEIGLIATAYNKMADTIYNQINTLEEKVVERTYELDLINQSLIENKEQLQLILDSAVEGIYGIDIKGNISFINASGLRLLGYLNADEVIGKNSHNLVHHSYKDKRKMNVEDCQVNIALFEGKGTHADDEVFWKKDGTAFNVEYYSYPQMIDGAVHGAVITFMDNTNKKMLEEQIFGEKEQFKTTLLSVGDAVISTDKSGHIVVMNPIAEKLTGWTQKEAYGKSFEQVINIYNELTREKCPNPTKLVIESGKIIQMSTNTILISKLGMEIPIEDSVAPIYNSDGVLVGTVIVFRDYTEKKEKLQEIEYLSFHDSLTGLYNRRYMEDAIKRLDTQRNIPFAIMILDVNGLKLNNDAFGHKMGDRLLMAVADVLRGVCRSDDIIGRIGGDEFEILLPKTDEHQAKQIQKRIIKAASAVKIDSIVVSLAAGYSIKTSSSENIEQIKMDADNKMYKNKFKHGKNMRSETIETVLHNINFKYDKEQIHTERVSEYCEAIAKAMNFSDEKIHEIKTAGVLHDIGKIMVPPEILNKAEKLTPKEFDIIKRHPETGYQILKGVDEYMSFAEDVLYHHERWDGKGYPEGLAGESIPLVSRIIAVADVYEAMTAKRIYQVTKSKEEAIEELRRCAGTQFDANIVKIFIEKVLL